LEASDALILVSLSLSALVFLLINYKFDRLLDFEDRYLIYIIGLLVVLTGLTVAADIGGGQVDYLTVYSNTTSVNDSSIEVGYVVARNEHMFSREFRPPKYTGCVYPDGSKLSLDVRYGDTGWIGRGELIQSPMYLDEPDNTSFDNLPSSLSISQRKKCPDNGTPDQIVMLTE
jgi:hypothetical protein